MKYACLFLLVLYTQICSAQQLKEVASQKRLIIIMFDGFGMSYYDHAPMPNLKQMAAKGFFKEVSALMPTVTNLNNTAICCARLPERTGITGNSFLSTSNQEEYMEDQSLLQAPTIFQKLKKYGAKSALIASKKKSIALLSKDTEIALSPETADSSWTDILSEPPGIYSSEVNFWTFRAALHILKTRPDIRCIYIHTTDYPMHMWAPDDSASLKHLAGIDAYLGAIMNELPDALVMITADHDVNHKSRCVDLENTLKNRQLKIKIAISAERDKYLKHHRGFGGTSYVYLNNKQDEARIKEALLKIPGVEKVLTRKEACELYHLLPGRIGDLVVLADSVTVFGNLSDNKYEEELPQNYRTHGSEYEKKVPLIIYNSGKLPPESYFRYNYNLTGWLME